MFKNISYSPCYQKVVVVQYFIAEQLHSIFDCNTKTVPFLLYKQGLRCW